jgi:uncharacterized membrane protein
LRTINTGTKHDSLDKFITVKQLFMKAITKFILFFITSLSLIGCAQEPQKAKPDSSMTSSERENSIATNSVWHKAKLRGVAFRAIGQEPAWQLEIMTGSNILVVMDYGQSRVSYDYVEPDISQKARLTEYQLPDLTIQIEGKPCQDEMSGEQFEVSVRLQYPNRLLNGCGRALY